MILKLKVAAAVLTLLGVVLGLVSLIRAPHALLLESSPKTPRWLPWVGWCITTGAAITYILVDYLSSSEGAR